MFFLLSVLAVGSFAHLSHSKAINVTTGPASDLSNEQYNSRAYPVPSLGDCFNSIGLIECLKSVTLRSLNKAINSDGSFRVTRFLVVKKNPDYNLVQVDERTPYDWYTIILRIRDFISSRIFQFSLADPEGRSLIPLGFEGRGKKHKHKHQGGFYMMGGVAFMAMVAQLVLGKVALLAAVALIMAKIALVFSTLNGFKKAAHGGGGTTEHVVYEHSGHGSSGSGWQRSIEPKRQGQYDYDDLPYRKRRPDYDYRDPLEGVR